jgi:hypothetical protein
METKSLIAQLEQIEYDEHNMRYRTLPSIIENIEDIMKPQSVEEWDRYTPYGRKRYAKLVFDLHPRRLVLSIEQSGTDGVYATYFKYEY